MTMPTATDITRLYLFGSTDIPDLVDDELIRPSATQDNVVSAPPVDINDYMTNGPGRFVNAASFEVVNRFFHSLKLPPCPPGGFKELKGSASFNFYG
jgi:hypothetical protein